MKANPNQIKNSTQTNKEFCQILKNPLQEAKSWLQISLTKEENKKRETESLKEKQHRILPIYQMTVGEIVRFVGLEKDSEKLQNPNFRNYQKAIRESLQLMSEIILVGRYENYQDFKELIYQIHNIAISYRTDNLEKKMYNADTNEWRAGYINDYVMNKNDSIIYNSGLQSLDIDRVFSEIIQTIAENALLEQLKLELDLQEYSKAVEIFSPKIQKRLNELKPNQYQKKLNKYFAYAPKKLLEQIVELFQTQKYDEIEKIIKKLSFGKTEVAEKDNSVGVIKMYEIQGFETNPDFLEFYLAEMHQVFGQIVEISNFNSNNFSQKANEKVNENIVQLSESQEKVIRLIAHFVQLWQISQPFLIVNNSLCMAIANYFLRKNGLNGISHGALDFVAFRLSLENYQNEFLRRVKMTSLK